MQLDYKILFVDDEGYDGYMGELKINLDNYLRSNGFALEDFEARSEADLDLKLSERVDYDIIFVDNRFDDNECGLKFIEKIRKAKIYADIILCTALSDIELRKKINAETATNGFFYLKKDASLIQQTYDIINFRLNKELDTNVMRGIAMMEVAKFDAYILEILKINEDKCKPHIIAKIKEKAKEKHDEYKESTADEKIWNGVSDPDSSTLYFDSSTRKDILDKYVLKNIVDLKECYNTIKDKYYPDVLKKRNILAHQIDPALSNDDKKQLRVDIIKFREIFSKINKYFSKS